MRQSLPESMCLSSTTEAYQNVRWPLQSASPNLPRTNKHSALTVLAAAKQGTINIKALNHHLLGIHVFRSRPASARSPKTTRASEGCSVCLSTKTSSSNLLRADGETPKVELDDEMTNQSMKKTAIRPPSVVLFCFHRKREQDN
jgi:hypothetical protein